MIWPLSSGHILQIRCGNVCELIHPIDFRELETRDSLDLIIDRYFDGNAPLKQEGTEYIFAQEMGIDSHGSFLHLSTYNIGTYFTLEFIGSLRALLIIGTEPCDP